MATVGPKYLLLLALASAVAGVQLPCVPRTYGENSVVCVCNATYCDTLEGQTSPPDPGTIYVTQSNKNGDRFRSNTLLFQQDNTGEEEAEVEILVDGSQEFQEMLGFGGAFTDAAGINFLSLPEAMKFHIINAYYSVNGSEYNMGRVPMASCDFSTESYSYDDHEGDMELVNFQLASQDLHYKIPFIQKASSISTYPLLLFGSPWAPPHWMKSNNRSTGPGTLKGSTGGEYYQTWANYFVKFLQAYEAQNITFWGLTTQNEPIDGFIPEFPFQCLGFTPWSQATFVAQNLGPTLQKAGYGTDKIKLMIMDDHRALLPYWADIVFSNETAKDYVSGIAFHWYTNKFTSPSSLDKTKKKFPDKFLLSTEACEGSYPWDFKKVKLGDWDRAEAYAHDIIEDLQHWTSGWIDWNLALDLQGGPNWVNNFVDSPIIVNATGQEFYKQPMYYALAHFSKFVTRGSKRIQSEIQNDCNGIEQVAFSTSKGIVLVILNRKDRPVTLNIKEVVVNASVRNIIPGNTIQSYIWNIHSKNYVTSRDEYNNV